MTQDDFTAPIGRLEVAAIARSGSSEDKDAAVSKILALLNEKRDAYNGLINSMIYMTDTHDVELVGLLQEGLIELFAADPMRYGGKMFIARCLPKLTTDQPEFVAELFAKLMRTCCELKFRNPSDIVRIQIIALRAISQAEQRTRARLTDIDQETVDKICDAAIRVADDTTKVDTLYLVLDTKYITKVIENRDLAVFRAVFADALNFQVPALRQKFMSITNKVMRRVANSIRVVHRDKAQFTEEAKVEITERYMDFLEWLVRCCLDNIYCNKYFGSFIITMSTLNYILEHITLDNPNLPIAPLFKSRRFYDSILSCVSLDSFEENKVMALKLLFALPTDEHYTFIRNLQLFEDMAYELVNSVNPAHSLTCQYIFKLVIGFRQRQTKLRKNQLVYQHLDQLIGLVEIGVKETNENFIAALKSNAIYPKLTCIRALLNEVEMEDLKFDRDKWEFLASRIVQASIDACQAISTIVCNMNPETIGHMPMDLKPVDAETLSKTFDVSVTISKDLLDTITSQHLLITGWKTIKECSLSMAALCNHLWWPKNDKSQKGRKPVLDSRSVREIVKFFERYLRNLRHRGAFEQAYNGFVLVTKRVWLDDEFKELLTQSLKEIMIDFKKEREELGDKKVEYLRNHITRRSAGLPFLVQAIVVSEDKKESKILHWTMNYLLDILDDSKAEVYQRIHCLNILMALMKDYNLGEKVMPFIGRTMIVTIDSFKSDHFPIRNCANMLMRVVVDRTFGANRLRDGIHKRNTMSFEKFFTEYPQIHPTLLATLSRGLGDKKCLASVHAVIIILNRLRPSINPSPDYSLEKVVRPFIEPVQQLAHTCADYNLRQLASKLCVQLESYCLPPASALDQEFLAKLQQVASKIASAVASDLIDRNKLHGELCVLRSWLDRCKTLDCLADIHEDLSRTIANVVKIVVLSNLDGKLGLACSTIKLIALDIAENYCLLYPNTEHAWLLDLFPYLEHKLQEAFTAPEDDQLKFGPQFENLILKLICTLLTSGCVPGQQLASFETEALYENLFELVASIITRPPNRILGLNLQAALVRLLRQFFEPSGGFVDKLLDNLDFDLTAALMTPIDKLYSKSELDLEYERWSKFCEQVGLRDYIRTSIPGDLLDRLFDFYRYNEFEILSGSGGTEVSVCNTPRSVELLALAYKSWSHYDLENRCIWVVGKDTTTSSKLKALTRFVRSLPDCDTKCLALMCASHLFKAELVRVYEHSKLGFSVDQQVELGERVTVLRDFTETLDMLADGDRNRILRETCSEILRSALKLALDCWCQCLKESSMNLLSTLIKLYQDEDFDIRQCSSSVLASLFNEPDRPIMKLDGLFRLIANELLEPSSDEDVLDCFNLMTRIIFNHSKNYTINFSDSKESLFDKTKPNVFADHVASIQSTLKIAQDFFQKASAVRGRKIDVDLQQLPPEVVAELEVVDTKSELNQQIGDYSWRQKAPSASPTAAEAKKASKVDNRTLVDRALVNVKLSLSYFRYRNMLLDTTFGYRESSVFKRLAFVKLLIESTDYSNQKLIAEIQEGLERTINESCATTILSKSRELFSL